jgi:farnesyl diphosphate synthase/geranylgeranyl diphosphate synthase type II
MSFSADAYLSSVAARLEPILDKAVSGPRARSGPPRLVEALRYSVLGGGKRLRPALVLASAEAHGGDTSDASLAMRFGVALELIHAYSLVHDDLPCMDDDDLRRGRPTVHKQYDEGTAVLAGDALQSLAFRHLLAGREHRAAELAEVLAANAYAMVEGQALDLAAETAAERGEPLGEAEVMELMAHKTGALIAASVFGGAIAATGEGKNFWVIGQKLGLAFQTVDDLLDLTSDAATLGKRVKKDAGKGKATLPSLLGVEEARRRADRWTEEALDLLGPYGDRAGALAGLARFVVSRRK